MEFLAQAFLRCLENPTEELAVSFSKSYETTLQQHHGFLVRNVFSVRFSASHSPSLCLSSLSFSLAGPFTHIHPHMVCLTLVRMPLRSLP